MLPVMKSSLGCRKQVSKKVHVQQQMHEMDWSYLHHWAWVRVKPGARNSAWVSHRVTGAYISEQSAAIFQGALARSLVTALGHRHWY